MQTRLMSAMPGLGRPENAVLQIVLHLQAPVAIPLIVEILAVAAGAAIVDLEHRIAGIGEGHGFRVVAPTVASAVRTAVRQHDQRQVLHRLVLRHGQVADQLHAVARLELHRVGLRKILRLHLWLGIEQVPDLAVVLVPQIELTPLPVAVDDAARARCRPPSRIRSRSRHPEKRRPASGCRFTRGSSGFSGT